MAKTILDNFIILIILFLVINSQDSDNEEDTLVLNYYYKDGRVYSIEEKEGKFKVLTKEVIYCFVSPCDFPILDEKPIEDDEDCQILKTLFDEIFKDSDVKEKSLIDEEIAEEQLKIILNVLEHNKIFYKLEYEILNDSKTKNIKYKKSGYIYEIVDESAIYTIVMGEKPTAGYSIEIQKVKIKGNNASIYVSEKVPGKDEMVDDVITYPFVQVKFNHLPYIIEIINYETGENYPCLI